MGQLGPPTVSCVYSALVLSEHAYCMVWKTFSISLVQYRGFVGLQAQSGNVHEYQPLYVFCLPHEYSHKPLHIDAFQDAESKCGTLSSSTLINCLINPQVCVCVCLCPCVDVCMHAGMKGTAGYNTHVRGHCPRVVNYAMACEGMAL